MSRSFVDDIAAVQGISAVPTLLETVAATTGLGFVCIARVTKDAWTTCAVLDKLDFGLKVGDSLDVTTTFCSVVRDTGEAVVIDCVSDDDTYRDHPIPKAYGFQSYISVPIFRSDGEYFGTLCGLDPKPAMLSTLNIRSTMALFAQLISTQLASEQKLSDAHRRLLDEQQTSQLREQFVAVLGHDLRTPLSSILGGIEVARRRSTDVALLPVFDRIHRSAQRMAALVDDVVDFTRGRMGGGISLDLRHEEHLELVLEQVIGELRGLYPDRTIHSRLQPGIALLCDANRIGQLLSNLLKNALVHGDAHHPVEVSAVLTNDVFRLDVTNAGVLIPTEIASQLFKPFWRGSDKSTHEGLGLGLFIVSQIAQSHRGEVNLDQAASTITFSFTVFGADFIERRKLPRP